GSGGDYTGGPGASKQSVSPRPDLGNRYNSPPHFLECGAFPPLFLECGDVTPLWFLFFQKKPKRRYIAALQRGQFDDPFALVRHGTTAGTSVARHSHGVPAGSAPGGAHTRRDSVWAGPRRGPPLHQAPGRARRGRDVLRGARSTDGQMVGFARRATRVPGSPAAGLGRPPPASGRGPRARRRTAGPSRTAAEHLDWPASRGSARLPEPAWLCRGA